MWKKLFYFVIIFKYNFDLFLVNSKIFYGIYYDIFYLFGNRKLWVKNSGKFWTYFFEKIIISFFINIGRGIIITW